MGYFNGDVNRSHKYRLEQFNGNNTELRRANSRQKDYLNDKCLTEWLNRKDFVALSKLYNQIVPYTFQNTQGHISFIDQVISKRDNPNIANLMVVVDKDEMEDLAIRNESNFNEIHRNCWPELNLGDHRGIITEAVANEFRPTKNSERKKTLDWTKNEHNEVYSNKIVKNLQDKNLEIKLLNVTSHMDKELATSEVENIIDEFNDILVNSEKEAIDEVHKGKDNRWCKSKPWFTKELNYLSKRRKVIRYVQKATGRCYKSELNAIRSEFRKIKKSEMKKLKDKERKILREKYNKCRIKFWREIGRRKAKNGNINIEQEELVAHFKDLFATKVSSNSSIEMDSRIENQLKSETSRIRQGDKRTTINNNGHNQKTATKQEPGASRREERINQVIIKV